MDTKLFGRHQPGGLFAIIDKEIYPGNIFWVDSGNAAGSDADGYGQNPDAPFKTIDYAIGKCTASNGDVVIVLPGHAENITTATAINCDVAGVTIQGIGSGSLIPTISTTAAAGSITIGAANVTLRNLRLLANFETGTTTMITIAAAGDGCTLDGLQFRDTSATFEALIHVSVATTVDDLTVKNCSFVTAAGSLTNSILFAGTTTNLVIEDNVFLVDSSDSVIDHAAGKGTDSRFSRNVVVNADTGAAGYCLELKSDSTGVANDNRFAYNKVDAEISVGAATWWFENYASNTIAESGRLDPTTAHAIP
jgi:hypothetical protein